MGLFDKLFGAKDQVVDVDADERAAAAVDDITAGAENNLSETLGGSDNDEPDSIAPSEVSVPPKSLHGFGPTGDAAASHLRVLGLSEGATWAEVLQRRNDLHAENPADGTQEQRARHIEANHAYAALRLLRAEPSAN